MEERARTVERHPQAELRGLLRTRTPDRPGRLSPDRLRAPHRERPAERASLTSSGDDRGDCGRECFGTFEERLCSRGAVEVGEQVRTEIERDEAVRELANGEGVLEG